VHAYLEKSWRDNFWLAWASDPALVNGRDVHELLAVEWMEGLLRHWICGKHLWERLVVIGMEKEVIGWQSEPPA
jgi:hypothetical protein